MKTNQPQNQQPAQVNLSKVNFVGKNNIDDQKSKFVTCGFMNNIIRNIRKKKNMDYDDILPISRELQGYYSARRIAAQYNTTSKRNQSTGKRQTGIISTVLKANKSRIIWAILCVPIISLCGVASPIAIRQFTKYLNPGLFYDCDKIFTDPDYKFQLLSYEPGVQKVGNILWGYILLLFFSQLIKIIFEQISYGNTTRIGVSLSSGMLDVLYNKILLLSDQARQSSATGNLVNLLYSDIQKVSLLVNYIPTCIQLPADIVINLIYLATEIHPIALVGLAGYLIFLPLLIIIFTLMFSIQKRLTSMRDNRVKRLSEILNGIKVIKSFSLEEIQEKRIFNIRKNEIKMLTNQFINTSFMMVIITTSTAVMTLIAFAAMIFQKVFDLSTAFTTMFMYQYLGQAIIMLPMILGMLAESLISSSRLLTFIKLPNKDPGYVVRVDRIDSAGRSSINIDIDQNQAIKITGNPNFTWGLAKDQVIPPILDPLFKENIRVMKTIKASILKTKSQAVSVIQEAIKIYQSSQDPFIIQDLTQLKEGFDNQLQDYQVVDLWCTEFDIPYLKRLETVEQYDTNNYVPKQDDNLIKKAKKLYLHVRTMQVFIEKDNKNDNKDLPDVLKNIDFSVSKGEIIGICGQVGHGKTSMFNAILGELRLSQKDRKLIDTLDMDDYIRYDYNICTYNNEGADDLMLSKDMPHVYINGSLAFFSQQPCIFSKTIRENIIFGKDFIKEKYNRIVDICCLLPDFDQLDGGDLTEVGAKGVTLSGGQKARIALARAVYSDANILLLDDPLSAVDAHVGARLWKEVIMGYLREKNTTVIIASHQTQYFQSCDRVMQIVKGSIAAFDTPINLTNQGVHILGLTDECQESSPIARNQIISSSSNRNEQTDNSVKAKFEHKLADAEKGKLVEQEELSNKGGVSAASYSKWFKAGSVYLAIIALLLILLQTACIQYSGIMVTHWGTNKYGWSPAPPADAMETAIENMQCISNDVSVNVSLPDGTIAPTKDCKLIIAQSFQKATLSSYNDPKSLQYVIQGTQMCGIEKYSMNISLPQTSSNIYLGLYAGLTVAVGILTYCSNIIMVRFCLSAAQKLNARMTSALLRTKMLFFDTTPQGRILNRLSKDTDSVDNTLVTFLQQALIMGFGVIGMVITIAATNYPALIVIIPAVATFVVIFTQFRHVFPHIKRVEAISRSPVFSACQETVESLICIRAYDVGDQFLAQFREAVTINTSLYFQNWSTMRWLAFRLGILTSFFTSLVAVACVLISPTSQEIAGYVGNVLTNGQYISMLLGNFVVTIVQFEGEMASVERVLEYTELESEGIYVDETFDKPNWPEKDNCQIEVRNLEFRYNKKQDYILKKIDFKFKPKEHIGIVGRTGAGKSTITVSMLRLAESENDSEIVIDGVNILKIGLHQARRALALIPQDPFLFSGTLRQNLCPVSQARAEGVKPPQGMSALTDEQLWSVLENVQMKEYFMNQPGGLDARIAANGDNLSAGQKQLVCVARALVRNAGCVILDEATAQVDRENDKLIQNTIRSTLKDTAVLSIAHRLDTVIDFDRIIVMDSGRIAEFDSPAALLRNESGVFAQLVDRTGPEMSQKLRKAAAVAEEQRKAGQQVQVEI